jgi:acyl-CoA-binding protein
MSDLNERFEQAALDSKSLPERPENEVLLELYGLYKQGSQGDIVGDKPGFFDFVAVAKYDAWEALQGQDSDEAKQKYIDLVERLKG